ncbi:GTPase/DUF3482 domain-containing protein [Pseudobacteriovorax antillogorgiicola]|uniref:50S ribosome-binding GTPase n=1 Tax=Pseudobacteriovorax antillogorgiicola TaxID=1513793 RepID=A0A1Y6CN93_9BACT|nr:GTPase/DUF3482 domain-containing protein [Pseudobacteriovorax antillogorgiicola]TCS46975.1 50S ribosome-binding GTPase [Pseudobacteriovorax antillogorgiicola]SMF64693.1 50S ribosome-binding GTPase [Pseudobacteriovorax antillogorgiicola]
MIPSFAVVGRSNKGKSSIVATLTENDMIEIAATPRTTQTCQEFIMRASGQDLFQIIDTPGFEEAPAVLEWLQKKPVDAHQRRQRVEEFLKEFEGTNQFKYERELLSPIIAGAAILYVADASRPYRSNYESEFEILRWTGQHSMALINLIGKQEYIDDWEAALNQYFRKVRVFDAHKSYLEDRVQLLEELKVIHDQLRPQISKAIEIMKSEHQSRLYSSAHVIANFILKAINLEHKEDIVDTDFGPPNKQELQNAYLDTVRNMEQSCRDKLLLLFQYQWLETDETQLEGRFEEDDLFSRQTWEILGLSRTKLVTLGTAVGALAGGGIDVMAGGASLLVGSGLGAFLGGGSSLYLAYSDPTILGFKTKKSHYVIGPNKNPNFPWVLLDRALLFVQSLQQRTHAVQATLSVNHKPAGLGLSSQQNSKSLKRLAWIFRKSKWGLSRDSLCDELAAEILTMMNSIGKRESS